MKRLYTLSLAIICVIAFSTVIFAKVVYEEDESGFGVFYTNNDYFLHDKLAASALCQARLLYEGRNDTFSLQPIILYLEKKEKSPPLGPITSPVV